MANIASHMYDFFQKLFPSKEYYSEIAEIVSFAGDLHCKKILEIGAGTCKVSAEIKNKFPDSDVTAADVSKSHLELGSKKADIKTVLSPTEGLDKRLKTGFDVVIGVDTIHHHTDRIKALENCYKLLKRGGVLILRDVSRFFPGFFKYKIVDKSDFLLSRLQGLGYVSPSYFSHEELEGVLKLVGFRKVVTKNLNRDGLMVVVAKK